ncbi:hypothetical protein BH11BAC2_BH11BAC2_03570 [soil metagenome]
MKNTDQLIKTNLLISFRSSIQEYELPERFTYPFHYTPHPLCLLAAKELQEHLQQQQVWKHNFGLAHDQQGPVIGKMFGVLLVKNQDQEIGYLAAFSGKLAGGVHHDPFVPPVYDMLSENSFLNLGMQELSRINQEIATLTTIHSKEALHRVRELKELRKKNSFQLQNKIFDEFHFLNQAGETKSLRIIFQNNANGSPASGAGECAAPKLLQYAFLHKLQPLAMAEFWWGQSPKTESWKHGEFYPACREKCAPILQYMLDGIELEEPPQH